MKQRGAGDVSNDRLPVLRLRGVPPELLRRTVGVPRNKRRSKDCGKPHVQPRGAFTPTYPPPAEAGALRAANTAPPLL